METQTDVLIIGTGFSGIGTAIKLREAGFEDFLVLERASAIGGTWRDNHYPGVACDVPSHLYSFSFEPNPKWSRLFAPQKEILEYLNACADKYGIRPHIRFDSEVDAAAFDERRGVWHVTTKDGRRFRARALVTACGGLSRPSYPEIEGLSRFAGKMFHTADWDHSYALEGKTVAVIGTGASAIQVVPAIVDRVKSLKLFQRTPPWILPKPDMRIRKSMQGRFARFPSLQRSLRGVIYGLMESRVLGFTNMVPSFQDNAEKQARKFLADQVKDDALRAKLTPSYRIGCKRILISNDYYAALQRDHAGVVTEGIRAITERGIVTADGQEHPVDVIVFATGFQAAEQVAPYAIRGRNGLALDEHWRDGAEGYLGSTVAGFPNLFTLTGPNTGLGHNSMVYMIESQIAYVVDAMRTMRERGLRWVDVKQSAQDDYNKQLHERMARTVWSTGGCVSWYRTKSGKNTTLWPGFTFEFRWRTRRFDPQNYQLEPQAPRHVVEPAAEPFVEAPVSAE